MITLDVRPLRSLVDLNFPPNWLAAEKLTFPYSKSLPSVPLDPHLSCRKCWDRTVAEARRALEEFGLEVEPAFFDVHLTRVRWVRSHEELFLWVGACQGCEHVYWAPDVAPTEAECAADFQKDLLWRQANELREAQVAEGAERRREHCARNGHAWDDQPSGDLIVHGIKQGVVLCCTNCGAQAERRFDHT